CEMSDKMQTSAIDCAIQAMKKYKFEKDIAIAIKRDFDQKHGPSWHCLIGRNCSFSITHENNCYINFYVDKVELLLFKCG
ncbi:hypothetical protein Ciccas_012736, partial [Cichlidogyrus casuarinus]